VRIPFLGKSNNNLLSSLQLNDIADCKPHKNYIMKDIQLFNEISSLPEDIKKEVSDFVSFLKYNK
jgi:hypothetical protein